MYIASIFHQLEVAIRSLHHLLDYIDEEDLCIRPTENKHSVGELLTHIVLICKADAHIADGASETFMTTFHSQYKLTSINDFKQHLQTNFHDLQQQYMHLSETQLQQLTTSYWGVTYSKYEWLLEILVHIYHHRGQLHAILTHCLKKDIAVPLFE
jgi:uncharacterized damage-inducible protein DinB